MMPEKVEKLTGYQAGGDNMSNAKGRSKKNLPTDANHVNAQEKAEQMRMIDERNQKHNDGRKYDGKI